MSNWPVAILNPQALFIWVFIPVTLLLFFRTSLIKGAGLKKSLILYVHILIIFIIGLAMSDPRVIIPSDRVNLFYCLDASASIQDTGRKKAQSFIKKSMQTMKKEDTAGLIVFGKDPSLEIDLTKDFKDLTFHSHIDPDFTNIHDSLLMAVGRLSENGKRRIILLSDGNQNIKDASEIANLAGSLNIEICMVPVASGTGEDEIIIEKLETPADVFLETPFEIKVIAMSSHETEADITLLRDNMFIENIRAPLLSGRNLIKFSDSLNRSGLYLYKAVLNSQYDNISENNEGLSFTRGIGRSKILYAVSDDSGDDYLVKTLETQGLLMERKDLKDLPRSMHELAQYNAVIIDNISANSLSYTFMDSVEKYVRDMGGGLVMVGGKNGFGAGHYNMTPIEKALPVSIDAPTDLELTGFGLILVIDKSNSMSETITGKTKLEAAKIAAFSSIELLNPTDKIGIIAFDSEPQWIVPVTDAGNHKEIAGRLSTLDVSGGTNLYPGLREAYNSLKDIESLKKHIIVLSDGLTINEDFKSLVESINKSNITVSTVAVGNDSDIKLMSSIAEWGGGRSYLTDDAANIPRIFVGDTKIAAQKIFIEDALSVRKKISNEILTGIPDDFPLIMGQAVSYKKPGAQTVLETQEGPLLATWRYGLGTSTAFMSDLSSQWGKDWVKWDYFGMFVSQMVKWTQKQESGRNYSVNVDRMDTEGRVIADILDDQRRFVNNLNLNLRVLSPSGTDQTTSLDQVLPGRYEGYFTIKNSGPYYLNIFDNGASGISQSQVFGYAIPYSVEFNQQGVNYDLLNHLASETKGRLLDPDENSFDIFSAGKDAKEQSKPLWPYLIPAALILFVLEILIRKLHTIGNEHSVRNS